MRVTEIERREGLAPKPGLRAMGVTRDSWLGAAAAHPTSLREATFSRKREKERATFRFARKFNNLKNTGVPFSRLREKVALALARVG